MSNIADAAASIGGSLGTSWWYSSLRVEQIVAEVGGMADGMSTSQLLERWDVGCQALNKADFEALGGGMSNALEKASLIEAGVSADGLPYDLTTIFPQRIGIGIKLFVVNDVGLTPNAALGAGRLGAVGGAARCPTSKP